MTNLIIEISKYFMIFMFAFYTYECFAAFRQKIKPEQREHILSRQCAAIFLIHFDACGDLSGDGGYQYADFLCGAGGTSGDDTDLLSIVLQQIIETFDEQSVHAFDDRVYHADKAFF